MRAVVSGLFAISLFSCAASGVEFSGYSTASKRLRADTLALVEPMFIGQTKCDRLEAVEADVPAIGGFLRNENVQPSIDGPIDEKWVASGCAQTATFDVTFTPDGNGGAFMSLQITDDN